jgi:hypothetical protein
MYECSEKLLPSLVEFSTLIFVAKIFISGDRRMWLCIFPQFLLQTPGQNLENTINHFHPLDFP